MTTMTLSGRKAENQHELNQRIELLIRQKDEAGGPYSDEDKALLNRYSGSGGLASKGARGTGLLYEFYTPDWLIPHLWNLARLHGFMDGYVLEPSCATGKLISLAPDKSKVVGFETNPVSRRIAEILYPEGKFYEGHFETAFLQPPRFTTRLRDEFTWLSEYPFSLVIGNPPYGRYKNLYSSHFTNPKFDTLETYFIYYGLMMLEKGGLLVYLLSSNFLRNGDTYDKAKIQISKIAELVDAFRLPPVFEYSEVPVDIIIMKKI